MKSDSLGPCSSRGAQRRGDLECRRAPHVPLNCFASLAMTIMVRPNLSCSKTESARSLDEATWTCHESASEGGGIAGNEFARHFAHCHRRNRRGRHPRPRAPARPPRALHDGQGALLLVLVNGLLIWTAYGVYSIQQTELQTLVARALEFDLEMRQYGPEADEARGMLRTDLVWAHEQFWGDDTSRAAAYEASYKAMGSLNRFLDGLTPKTPAQTSLLTAARANYAFIGEQRLLMSLQAATPVPWPLIYAVTFWASLLFASMGLLSKLSPMSIAMLVLGSASIGLAIFLILEFSQPYTSSIRVSPAPLEQAILQLDQPSVVTPAGAAK